MPETEETSPTEQHSLSLGLLASCLPAVFYRCRNDEQWTMEYISPAIQELAGYPASALLNNQEKSWFELIHPDDRESVSRTVQESLSQDHPFSLNYRIITASGEIRPVLEQGHGIRDSQGKVFILQGYITDIGSSESIQWSKALQESEQRFHRAFHHASAGMLIIDRTGHYLAVNPAYCRILGYNESEVLGRNLIEFTHPDDIESSKAYVRELVSGEISSFSCEKRYIRKNGEVVWVRVSVSMQPGVAGMPGRIIAIVEDINQQRLAEEQARESQALMRMASKLGRLGAWRADLSSRQLFCSDIIREILELTDDDFPDLDQVLDFYLPQYREKISSALRACAGTGSPFDMEAEIRGRQGRQSWIRILGEPELDSNSKVIAIQGALQDISERRIMTEQIHRSQRLDSLGQLTGGIAHDFNNLLTVITGNAELITELTNEEQIQNLARMIGRASQRGAELTRHLLAFARKQSLELKALDVNALLDDLHELLRRTLGANIRIRINKAGQLPLAMSDPAQLESALLNLAINARDAMPQGGELFIESAETPLDENALYGNPESQPGPYVSIRVADQGQGIPPEHMERLFEPFFTTKQSGKGTGLGLPMVFGFIKQAGGHISIESELGKGTAVTLYLPLATGTGAKQERTATRVNEKGHESILLVEDESMVREYALMLLKRLGYTVHTAGNAQEALEHLQQHGDISLLFTDVMMPGDMNGKELAAAAKVIRPDIRVLYSSGYAENILQQNGSPEAGIILLQKPYRKEELARKVREALDPLRP